MLMLIAREPRSDFPYWPGRRLLAALDALAWPTAAVCLVATSPTRTGIVGAVVMAVAGITCACRLRRALMVNHRYQFTTWTWGWRVVAVLALGLLLKLAVGS